MHSVTGVAVEKHAGTPSDLLAKKHTECDRYSHANPDGIKFAWSGYYLLGKYAKRKLC